VLVEHFEPTQRDLEFVPELVGREDGEFTSSSCWRRAACSRCLRSVMSRVTPTSPTTSPSWYHGTFVVSV